MNKYSKLGLLSLLSLLILVGCSGKEATVVKPENQGLKVVTTIFPQYDFTREIGGEKIDLKMLIQPGSETHSYEPSPQDIIDIENSDLFIYVGGESDSWVEKILKDMDKSPESTLALMDLVKPLKEEIVEGMEEDSHGHDHLEYDEHVWTSLANDKIIVESIKSRLAQLDPKNSQIYEENTAAYLKKLDEMQLRFENIISQGSGKPLIFADRFPFLYFAKEYDLDYYGAFSGCSTQVEASPATIKFLIDKVEEDQIPVVFYIEFSNEKMADVIIETTGAKKLLLNSGHNLTRDQFKAGTSYMDILESNAKNLEEALR